MKKFKTWASESMPRWWVFVLLLMVAVLVKCDDKRALEANSVICETTPGLQSVSPVDSLAREYVEIWGAWWRLDQALARQIIRAADRERVSRATAFGLVAIESGFDSLAISSAGAVGLTQVKPSTARIYDKSVSVESLQKVDENLNIGLRYYHDLLHMFDGDVYLALAAYNMGPTAVAKRIEGGRKVSMEYSNKVLGK